MVTVNVRVMTIYSVTLNFQQYFYFILAVSLIYGVNQRNGRRPLTYRESLTNFFSDREHLKMDRNRIHFSGDHF